jgi:predicted MPP superfamily phosphohydrolase
MVLSRREFLGSATGVLVTGALGAIGTALHEPYEIAVTQIDIELKRLPPAFNNCRIAQLSDLHFNSFTPHGNFLERVVELTNAQKPDLVILTGDYVTAGFSGAQRKVRAEQAWPCGDILRRIEAPLGCFAVLGNHDYSTNVEIVTRALSATGRIAVLRNRSTAIEKDGARLWLAGIDNVTKRRARPDEALRGVPREECTIVAVHEPDFADEMLKYPVDFQLSGHSHGGQIRLPMVGALYFPPGAEKYPLGHYRFGKLQLYTNRGIGVIGLPMRFMCPPEITLFTLKTTPKS